MWWPPNPADSHDAGLFWAPNVQPNLVAFSWLKTCSLGGGGEGVVAPKPG